jgi:hypothetical protein
MIMKQTIIVKTLPCTATKPQRLKATHSGGVMQITESRKWDSEQVWEYSQHYNLACKLCDRLGWEYPNGCGVISNDSIVFTFTQID